MKMSLSFFIALFCLISVLSGDVIHLKNGREIEGKVIIEKANKIVVQMQMGTVTFNRQQIEFIEKTVEHVALNKSMKEDFSAEIKSFKKLVASLYHQKGIVQLLAGKSKSLSKKSKALTLDLLEKRKAFHQRSVELKPYAKYSKNGIPRQLYDQYVLLYSEYQALGSEIESIELEFELLSKDRSEADDKTRNAQQLFDDKLNALNLKYLNLISEGCRRSDLQFVQRAIDDHESVLSRQRISLTRKGNSYYLPVTINDTVIKEFILDTGCSLVALNDPLANLLNISEEHYSGVFQTTIADGSTRQVYGVYLERVTIGSFTVENVEAAVPVNANGNAEPLLLGMSFLKHFKFSIDAQTDTLVLERLGIH